MRLPAFLVFLLPALLGRPPFGFLPLLLNSLLLLLNWSEDGSS